MNLSVSVPPVVRSGVLSLVLGLGALAPLTRAQDEAGMIFRFTTFAGAPGGFGSNDGNARAARFHSPGALAMDGDGSLYVADTGNHTIRKITAKGVVTTLAGLAGRLGYANGVGSGAFFNTPSAVAVDANGNVLVADTYNHAIRKITPAGVVTTLAGSPGANGSVNGAGARFFYPRGIAVDRSGNVFVADGSQTIIKIAADGVVTTLAGLPNSGGTADGTGSAARFDSLESLTIDASGNLYVARSYNSGAIRKITPAGVVTTLPTGTQLGEPAGLAVDRNGDIFVTERYRQIVRKVSANGVVTTMAGVMNDYGSVDGAADRARFNVPSGVALDANGNLFVADTENHNIRKIAAGVVTTFAGGAGAGANDGPKEEARFNEPRGIALDRRGNLFIADGFNCAVRKIGPDGFVSTVAQFGDPFISDNLYAVAVDARDNIYVAEAYEESGWLVPDGSIIRQITADGTVSTLAGFVTGTGYADGKGNLALFNIPRGVAVDALGTLYVADSKNHSIRQVTATGVVTTFAGSAFNRGSADSIGRAAQFNNPGGIAVDARGNVYVADTGNDAIRKITPDGGVSTLAGSSGTPGGADGVGRAAQFHGPRGIAVDAQGNVYVADTGNHTIRKINPTGVVTTIAGRAGEIGVADDAGGAVRFNGPTGVAVDALGNLYVVDTGNNTLRRGTLLRAPAIATQPQSQTIARGRTVMFSATASDSPALAYQWMKDGLALAGATDSALVLSTVTAASAGIYQCVVTNAAGSITTVPATLAVVEALEAGRFSNFSVRISLAAGRNATAGFVVDGAKQKTVLVRGLGPALVPFGVNGALADPRLEIFNSAGQRLAENDNWPTGLTDVFAATGAFALPGGSKDAAILLSLSAGSYTAVLSGSGEGVGESLLEIYEVP